MYKFALLAVPALLAFIGSVSALADTTVFTAQDALQDILASSPFDEAVAKLAKDYDLRSIGVQQSGQAPTNSFAFTFVYAPSAPPPAGIHANCLITAGIASKVEKSTLPGGAELSVTVLTDLAVDGPVCQH